MDQPDSPATTPKRPRKKLNIPPLKAALASAMLDQGMCYRKVTEATGISHTTVGKIAKQNVLDVATAEHAEKIKKGLRHRWALLADQGLTGITENKIAEASAKELAYIAAKATEMAGLAPPSVVENYSRSIAEYIIQDERPTTGGGSIVDVPSHPE